MPINIREFLCQCGKIRFPVVVYDQWCAVVTERHPDRLPTELTATLVFDDPDRRCEQHELEARRAALNDADASTRKLVNTLPIHQIGLVATGTPETAEFKERIRASFARIGSIRLSKMQ